jgi:hypothetical protein
MERTARLLNQLESTPEGFKAVATEDELGPLNHAAASCTRKGPPEPFPAYLPSRTAECAGACGLQLLRRITAGPAG